MVIFCGYFHLHLSLCQGCLYVNTMIRMGCGRQRWLSQIMEQEAERRDETCLGTVTFGSLDGHMLLLHPFCQLSPAHRDSHTRTHFVLFTSPKEPHSIHRTQKQTPIGTKEHLGYMMLSNLHEFLAMPELCATTGQVSIQGWAKSSDWRVEAQTGPECGLGPDDAPSC